MRLKGLTFLLIICSSFYTHAHNEVVGQIHFENYQNTLSIKAILNKKHLTLALEKEGNCSLKDMLKVCGEKYFNKSICITVNNDSISLKSTDYQLEKEAVIFTYQIKLPSSEINSIGVNSNYMLSYNDHGIVKASFLINDITSSYNLSSTRKQIIAHF